MWALSLYVQRKYHAIANVICNAKTVYEFIYCNASIHLAKVICNIKSYGQKIFDCSQLTRVYTCNIFAHGNSYWFNSNEVFANLNWKKSIKICTICQETETNLFACNRLNGRTSDRTRRKLEEQNQTHGLSGRLEKQHCYFSSFGLVPSLVRA